jgi:hypothetical protein
VIEHAQGIREVASVGSKIDLFWPKYGTDRINARSRSFGLFYVSPPELILYKENDAWSEVLHESFRARSRIQIKIDDLICRMIAFMMMQHPGRGKEGN